MAIGDIGAVLDTLQFDAGSCSWPYIVHINGEIYAIAYKGVDGDGFLVTVSIDSSGDIGAAVIDTLEFASDEADTPNILHVSGDVYAIFYMDINSDGRVITVTIETDGSITGGVIDSQLFETGSAGDIHSIHVTGIFYASVFSGPDNDGFVVTTAILPNGTITTPTVDSFEFDTVLCITPKIIHVDGVYFAVVYARTGIPGIIRTITIDASGNIGPATIDSFNIPAADFSYPTIVHVSGDYFAVAHVEDDSDGFVFTITISTSGDIGAAFVDNFEFAASDCGTPIIIPVAGSVFVICYYVPTNEGHLQTLDISSSGVISTPAIDTFQFSSAFHTTPDILHVTGDIYLIAYPDDGDLGLLRTVAVETSIPVGGVRHELIMGIG